MSDAENPVSQSEARGICLALTSMGLSADHKNLTIERLSGGVSSDVYRVGLGARTICLKRALPKLRVAADWRAPATRSSTEVAWLKLARAIAGECVPEVLGEDIERHIFAMEFFPPGAYPVWKSLLAAGCVAPSFAEDVGRSIARIHGATAHDPKIAEAFANDSQFMVLRLEPFFLTPAIKHADVAARLRGLAGRVARSRVALMHGDVSPKNILCGPKGPVFLDAETACYGDPAFDLAFCLNHLLLKCVWHPEWQNEYLECFARLASGYRSEITWEAGAEAESRAAALLPALLLARVDGKSPADYLLDERKRRFVRTEAIAFLRGEEATLGRIAEHWQGAIAHEFL